MVLLHLRNYDLNFIAFNVYKILLGKRGYLAYLLTVKPVGNKIV